MLSRRRLITGLISFAAAPAIVKIENIMPVKVIKPSLPTLIKPDYSDYSDYLTLNEFIEKIIAPMTKRLERQVADAILNGNSYGNLWLKSLHGNGEIELDVIDTRTISR